MTWSKKIKLDNCCNDGPIGYFLEVDLDYPDKLHDLHNYYTLTPDKIKVMKQMFSKYQLQIVEKNKFCLGKNEKLIPNLAYKTNTKTPL